jgi:hypothetical protein
MVSKKSSGEGKRMPGQSSKSEVVTVRFGTEEFKRLKDIADREGVGLATVIRRAVQAPTVGGGVVIPTISRNPTSASIVGNYSIDGGAHVELPTPPNKSNLSYSPASGL